MSTATSMTGRATCYDSISHAPFNAQDFEGESPDYQLWKRRKSIRKELQAFIGHGTDTSHAVFAAQSYVGGEDWFTSWDQLDVSGSMKSKRLGTYRHIADTGRNCVVGNAQGYLIAPNVGKASENGPSHNTHRTS